LQRVKKLLISPSSDQHHVAFAALRLRRCPCHVRSSHHHCNFSTFLLHSRTLTSPVIIRTPPQNTLFVCHDLPLVCSVSLLSTVYSGRAFIHVFPVSPSCTLTPLQPRHCHPSDRTVMPSAQHCHDLTIYHTNHIGATLSLLSV
jgi:hypothetical protein